VSEAPPPADLAAKLAVLRRPQTPADRATIDAFRNYGTMRILYAQSLRLLRADPDGTSWYLFAGKSRAVRYGEDCLRQMPPGLRRSMRAAERRSLRESRRVRFGVFQFDGSESGGFFGGNLRTLGRGLATFSILHAGGSRDVSGLVPDGVASVEVTPFGRTPITAPVTDNLWTVDTGPGPLSAFPAKTVWKAADGSVIGSFRVRGR
jgi:hypothetical protein